MVYNCKIWKEKNAAGDDIHIVQFPDMPNIATCGFSPEEALAMAKEALDACLETDLSQGQAVPAPAFAAGYPITVSSRIAQSLRLLCYPYAP